MHKVGWAIVVALLLFISCSPKEPTPTVSCTVTFQDHDGTVLSTQTPADEPPVPQREGYVFVGWDKDPRHITVDTTLTAQYVQTTDPTFAVVNTTASAGETVRVSVAVVNNPGVAGAKITMIYDPALTLVEAQNGDAFVTLDYTPAGKLQSPCNFTWDSESGQTNANGNILWLSFKVPADAASGKTYAVNCICREGDIYDENLADVTFQTINGVITVQ